MSDSDILENKFFLLVEWYSDILDFFSFCLWNGVDFDLGGYTAVEWYIDIYMYIKKRNLGDNSSGCLYI
jgi:hypothetical protein